MTDRISYAVDGNVARITLDDGKVNAMSLPFFEALGAALDRAEREKPGAVVITGRAGYFSAGLDLKLMPTLAPDELQRMLLSFGRTMLRVFTFPIPTVAALSGHAIAGGAAGPGGRERQVGVVLALRRHDRGERLVEAPHTGELVPRLARRGARHRAAEPAFRARHRRGVPHARRRVVGRRAGGAAPSGRAARDRAFLRFSCARARRRLARRPPRRGPLARGSPRRVRACHRACRAVVAAVVGHLSCACVQAWPAPSCRQR